MIVNIIENSNIKETKINIECNKTDESIIKLVRTVEGRCTDHTGSAGPAPTNSCHRFGSASVR